MRNRRGSTTVSDGELFPLARVFAREDYVTDPVLVIEIHV